MERLNTFRGIQRSARMARQTRVDHLPIALAAEEIRDPQPNLAAKPDAHRSVFTALYADEVESDARPNPGDDLCNYQEEMRQLSAQLLTIQETERQRIAADLHDGIGQSLSLIKLSLETAMQQLMAGESIEAVQVLGQLTLKVKETMNELHRTTMDMRPSMLDDLGIVPTLSWFFREFESAWRGRKIEQDVHIAENDVPVPLKTTIFRILQEAVNNIVKHADADLVRVSLKRNGRLLQLAIEDNGCGFDLASVSIRDCSGHGFGLLTMRERARSSGGTFDMQSSRERGTRIFISWQLTTGTAELATAQLPCVRKSSRSAKR